MRIIWDKEADTGHAIISSGEHSRAHGWVTDFSLLRIGDIVTDAHCKLRLVQKSLFHDEGDLFRPSWICRVLEGLPVLGETPCSCHRDGFSLGWITLSDKASRGERVDESGPAIRDMVAGALDICLSRGLIIPDEPEALKHALVDFCLHQGFDLVFTTGGTGVGPRDIAPETTLALLDKRLPGFERAMTWAALEKTPHAVISRAVAGTMGLSLVLNLPGSPKAVRENLLSVLPAVRHAVEKLQGDLKDCGHVS